MEPKVSAIIPYFNDGKYVDEAIESVQKQTYESKHLMISMSDSIKLLSVIIPIYNMGKYLSECLTSLQRQNFGSEVEILLLDDGSTDSSSLICDRIANVDTHFRVFHQENRGVAATRNRGLDEATGKYIAWVDPDDYITDDWWQVLYPVLAQNPDIVYFDMKLLKDGKFKEMHFDKKSRIIGRDEWLNELANGNRIMSHLWSKVFLRTLFKQGREKIRFNEYMSCYEDYQALHRITWPVRECVYLHNCLYIYRQVSNSIVHDSEQVLLNAWLGIEVCKERRNFYRMKNMDISDFCVLYAKFKFCITYRKEILYRNVSSEMQKTYDSCLTELMKNQDVLWHGNIGKGEKMHLFLLMHHLYFLVPVLQKLKRMLF